MEHEAPEKEGIGSKWTRKYKLVLLNPDSFEERTSFFLSRLNVALLLIVTFVVILLISLSLVIFTPASDLIPENLTQGDRKKMYSLIHQADSLREKSEIYHDYFKRISVILNGLDPDSMEHYPAMFTKVQTLNIEDYEPAFWEKDDNLPSINFFTPLKGLVSQAFSAEKKHFGIDIVADKGSHINAALDGTVVLSSWTAETGYNILVQHSGGLISSYKHNSVLLKKEGDLVKAGEAIAIIGNSGELTSGPHLHFELWFKGEPIDPALLINFN